MGTFYNDLGHSHEQTGTYTFREWALMTGQWGKCFHLLQQQCCKYSTIQSRDKVALWNLVCWALI